MGYGDMEKYMRQIITAAIWFIMATTCVAGVKSMPIRHPLPGKDTKLTSIFSINRDGEVSDGHHRIPMKAPIAADEISGPYHWRCYWALQQGSNPANLKISLIDESKGEVEITGWVKTQDFKVRGTVNYEAGTLTLLNDQYLGKDSYGEDCYFYFKTTDSSGKILPGKTDVEEWTAEFAYDAFIFDGYDLWAIGNPDNENAFWSLTYFNRLARPVAVDEEEEGRWVPAGMCTIEDAWILPSFSIGGRQLIPSEHPFQAELQRSVDNENRYRVWRPYHSDNFLLASENESIYNGQIVFDVSDPEHVVVEAGHYAGFADAVYSDFCVFGMLGYQIYGFGDDWSEDKMPWVIDFMEEKGQPFDTFKDNVVTVNYSVFDQSIDCEDYLSWQDNRYVVSRIILPEPDSVDGVSMEEATAKYYNLQGMEVVNPAVGSLVIRRQGGKSTKILFR